MQVKKYVNKLFSSNTYLLYNEEETVWIIDPGDSSQIIKWIRSNNKIVKGIFLTHYHIDHIYGVNDFYEIFPKLKIYASEFSLEGLFNSKVNKSYYLEDPYVIKSKEIQIVSEPFEMNLFSNREKLKVLNTPGHNIDCLSFEVNQFLFTGDALIPEVKVHTRSKLGDKKIAKETIDRLFKEFNNDIMICPGHGEMKLLGDINIKNLIN